ncbi:histidine kinase [Massilia sp. IC2-278]|uniref:sensor histidine kinase n=1 Tax=Massilia sp. IC2-278 TaxID=2887200 RepID=UPI001E2CBB14|nr:histidine kinase [Massilia sp. IC2-278]MCC2959513.1 histidine kinase [Massilia sp. IC2-278]
MKSAFVRTAGAAPGLMIVGACALAAGLPGSAFPSSAVTALIWLLGAAGALCLLLRRSIDLDDRARELAARLCLEQKARQVAEGTLADTQTVLTRVVRQQESVRDGERKRIARDIDDELGQVLVALRGEMSLLQVASAGIHPATHQKTGAMIGTLDLALRALRVLAGELRPLAAGERLGDAMARQLAEFTRLNGIAHQFEASAGDDERDADTDALLYRALQETLAQIARSARATRVGVQLSRSNARLSLCIEDDGDADGSCAGAVAALRERVAAAGGAVHAEALPGGGKRLAIVVSGVHGVVPG